MIEVQYQPQEHPYKLSHAILFYRNNQGTLATLHKIRNKQFMSGKSLDPAELEELLHTPNQQRRMNCRLKLSPILKTKFCGLRKVLSVPSTSTSRRKRKNVFF